MNSISEFFASYYLWNDAIIIAAVSGAVCGFVGVYVVLRRIVFVSATLTQISGLGVVSAFYIQSITAVSFLGSVSPFYFAIFITCVSAVFFSLHRDFSPVSMEGIIGFGFLIAASLTIIISDNISHGAHEVDNIMFGSAVVVDRTDLISVPVISILVMIVHTALYKDFVFVSFDSETAKIYGYPVKLINIIMYLLLGIMVAVSTRAIGAIPVFSMLTLPALTSLYLTEKLKYVFVFSFISGTFAAMSGYFVSFIFSIPTGASMVLCSSLIFIAVVFLHRLKKVVRYHFT